MAWEPTPPDSPAPGWWAERATAAEEAERDRWIEGIADGLRAERIERLRAATHAVDMRAAGALAADRWERIQRRRDRRDLREHPGGIMVNQWGARGEVEHSGAVGRVLDVR